MGRSDLWQYTRPLTLVFESWITEDRISLIYATDHEYIAVKHSGQLLRFTIFSIIQVYEV